jgi:phospholipid/cholesterol/gamma-HCH transport system substrate-binding protein
MNSVITRNIKLGIFILSGTLFFLVLLYFIGSKRSIFYSTIKIKAQFFNAEGLMRGNSVRLSGINIGTVESVSIINDSTVLVEMIVQKSVKEHIKKNSVASIGTDGLMGNKLVNIASVNEYAKTISEGDELITYKGINSNDMVKTLSVTNENIKNITTDLKEIVSKMNQESSILNLMSDKNTKNNIQSIILNLNESSKHAKEFTFQLNVLSENINQGKGTLGLLAKNNQVEKNVFETIAALQQATKNINTSVEEINQVTTQVKSGNGTIGSLVYDTLMVKKLNNIIINTENASKYLAENMEALQHTFLLRKQFKKKSK